MLDTETTGLEVNMGHRILEIGCVELVNRRLTGRHFHKYINPERPIDAGAAEVHGITSEFLADKPKFTDIWQEFIHFISGSELVIHNAKFDVTFLDYELSMLSSAPPAIADICRVTDSLELARRKHPGQKNNLDALCRRYEVDNSQRELHGALLDAEILADVYLLMTGGQTTLFSTSDSNTNHQTGQSDSVATLDLQVPLIVVSASAQEQDAHEQYLDFLAQQGTEPIWRRG